VLDALVSEQAIVPELWHLDVANTLVVGERRKRSTQADTVAWLGFLSYLPITVDQETKSHAFGTTAGLARVHGLSVHDAAYLELALRRGLPLATLDEHLKSAAKAVGVPLFPSR
jgi:predicted nucleic acid-binding protein